MLPKYNLWENIGSQAALLYRSYSLFINSKGSECIPIASDFFYDIYVILLLWHKKQLCSYYIIHLIGVTLLDAIYVYQVICNFFNTTKW